MIKLSHYSFKYDNRDIFINTQLEIPCGALVTITGESGSGKTTLLKSLRLENDFEGSYFLDEINLLDTTNSSTVHNIVYQIDQEPLLIEELTIEENYSLFSETFMDLDHFNTIELLEIKQLMNKYPNQLSGGEIKRVALSIGIIRNSKIFLVDEPTSHLDEKYSSIVIDILKKYASAGNYVIVSSHDLNINKVADVIYNIEYCKLNLIKKTELDISSKNSGTNQIELKAKNYFQMIKYQFTKRKIVSIMKIIGIILVVICLNFNNAVILFHNNAINSISSKEIQVYKSNKDLEYSYSGDEYPISQDEEEKLDNIDHVESIHWRMDLRYFGGQDEYGNLSTNDKKLIDSFSIIDENSNKIKIFTDTDEAETYFSNTVFQNYDNEYSISTDKLLHEFKDKNGIYLTKEAAEILTDNIESLNGKKLQLMIMVPVYNCDGVNTITFESGKEYSVNSVAGKGIVVTIPISGILKTNGIYDTDATNGFQSVIAVPSSYYDSVEKVYPNGKEYTYYYVRDETGKGTAYFDTVPEEYKHQIEQTNYVTAWRPSSYTIQIDDLKNLDKVLYEIDKIGLNARCIYLNSNSLKESLEMTQNSIRIVGLVVLALILIMQYKVNKNSMIQINKTERYLLNAGMPIKEVNKSFIKKQLLLFSIESFLCITFSSITILVMNYFWLGNTGLSIQLIAIILLLLFIIDVIYFIRIRYCLKRGKTKMR